MLADEVTVLHRFAFRLGIKLSSYQGPAQDLCAALRHPPVSSATGRAAGAVECSRQEIVAVFRRVKVPNGKVRRRA